MILFVKAKSFSFSIFFINVNAAFFGIDLLLNCFNLGKIFVLRVSKVVANQKV